MLRQTFSFIVYGVAIYDVVTQIFYYGQPFKFGFYIFQFAFSGVWFGYEVWGNQEGKYKEALKSSPQTSLQPH